MKRVCVILLGMILLVSFLVIAQENTGKVEEYAETTGVYLLKFQNFLMGALSFISLGVFKQGGTVAFAQFLFMIVLFMVLYSIVGFISDKFAFWISLLLTIVAFSVIDASAIQLILMNYESMGVAITVILPILILLAFTFRMYQRAYEGESEKSPFYAEIFNLVFLVFFGIFFIRYSASEEGVIRLTRFVSGWVLIGLGFSQFLIYKIVAKMFHSWWFNKGNKEEEEMKEIKNEAREKIEEIKDEEKFSYMKGMRRGGGKGKNGGRFVKRKSAERYAKMFGGSNAKKRFS